MPAAFTMAGPSISDKFNEMPVNTRWMMLLMVLVTVGGNFGMVPLAYLYFDPELVMKFQVWRLVTNFFFLGQLGFPFLMYMMILHQHSTKLEVNHFNTPADFLVMLIVCGSALMICACFMSMPFAGMGLVFSIVYVWAKENAEEEVNFVFNLARFKAFYLPWAYVALAILMGQSPMTQLSGIAAGHVYVFLSKIFPAYYNKTVIWTPDFLHALYGTPPPGAGPTENRTWNGAYSWGSGNRLGGPS